MKRAMCVVPAAVAITAVGLMTVAQAAPVTHPKQHTAASRASAPLASHRGSATDRAVTSAIQHSPLLGEVPASDVSVHAVRIAAADGSWASAVVHPIDQRTDDASVALHRVKGNWSVVMLGTDGVGCSVPTSLRAGLRLTCEPGH